MANLERLRIGNSLDVQDILPIGSLTESNGFLYTYGLVPMNPETRSIEDEDVQDQARVVLDNLVQILGTRGLDLDDIVMVQIFLGNIKRDFERFNEVYTQYFPEDPPTRYCIGATLAPLDGPEMLVEIHAIAATRST